MSVRSSVRPSVRTKQLESYPTDLGKNLCRGFLRQLWLKCHTKVIGTLYGNTRMFMNTLVTIVTTDFWSPRLPILPMFLSSPLLSRLFGYEGYQCSAW